MVYFMLLIGLFKCHVNVCLFVCFWRYFSRQVCDLEEKIVHSVQDTLKLIELGNKLR